MRGDENEDRAAFVAEAKTWLGTPFRDQGDVKGKTGAVDCAMLLVRSAQARGLIDAAFDPRPYPPQWHLHRDEERFLNVIGGIIAARGRGAEIENPAGLPAEALAKPGDVIVYRVGRCFSHGGIVIENNLVLHAYYKTGHVGISPLVEAELALLPDGRPRPFKLYDLWPPTARRPSAEGAVDAQRTSRICSASSVREARPHSAAYSAQPPRLPRGSLGRDAIPTVTR